MKKDKAYKYIDTFPKPFLEDLISSRVLPFVGAGFSKNAIVPIGKKIPDWNELGESVALDIKGYKHSNALDSISAYSHEYSRASLIEKITKLLLVDEIKPGKAHKAFCNLQFDVVCTTNFEFLLEEGYASVPKPCTPIIEEGQLAISTSSSGVALLKLHGDIRHPSRLVVTEEDYDDFLVAYPLIATYLANLLISRTALFVGYSLDDGDFRQIWQVIKNRLGKLRRPAYVLKVDCPTYERSRYERRGVKVIDIQGNPKNYGKILEDIFLELRDYWTKNTPLKANKEETLAELALPSDANNRLVFFALPWSLLPFYKENIFPVILQLGLIPITAEEVISVGDNWIAKVTALIEKAEFLVVDTASQNTAFELGLAVNSNKSKERILIIQEGESSMPVDVLNFFDIKTFRFIQRSKNPYKDSDDLVSAVKNWFGDIKTNIQSNYENESTRLLRKKENKAAIIAAISLLEATLRNYLELHQDYFAHSIKFNDLLYKALNLQLFSREEVERIKGWYRLRNIIVHTKTSVTQLEATEIVNGVNEFVKRIEVPDR